MEPLDYLKIVQRHWKVVAGLVVVALVLTFVLSSGSQSKSYEATHVLIREQASTDEEGLSSADNVEVVAERAQRGEVPRRVAERLGFEGSPEDLAEDHISAIGDPTLGTVSITATADDPDEAATLANTFADELVAFLDESEQARRQGDAEEVAAQEQQIRDQIAALAPRIAAGGADGALAQAESDALAAQLGTLGVAAADDQGTRYASLERPTNGRLQNDLLAGASRGQKMLFAAVVAAILGFGVAIMLDRSDQRLHTKQQAERQFGLPVLAEVPLLPVRARHRAAVWAYENDPRIAEAYRGLRTALLLFRDRLPLEIEAAELAAGQHMGGKHGSSARQIIVVTSPEAGDGKSTTAANLAMAYAEAGQRALLIQWDLWRPLPARVLDAEDGPGVSEFLEAGSAPLVRFVQETSVPGLQIIPAGRTGHQPGGQLDAELRLLEEARALSDVVIVDTAPILTASATRELVAMADVVVMACRAGRTGSPAAQRAAELLERLGAPVLGVVLVGVPTGPFTDYYGVPATTGRGGRVRSALGGGRGDNEPVPSGQHGPGSSRRHYRFEGPGPDNGYSQ